MPNQKPDMPSRLLEARKQRGLSQERVAEWLGVRRPAIAEIEAGKRAVKSDELARLADLYGKSLRWLVEGEEGVEERLNAVLFRANLKEDGLVAHQVAKLARRCRLMGELEQALGLTRHHRISHYADDDALTDYSDAMEHGKEVAYQERIRLGLGPAAPIRDVWGLVEDAGLHVFPLNLGQDSELDGIFARDSGGNACVGINVDRWFFRQVFTVAHEYGHALMDRDVVGEACKTRHGWKFAGKDIYGNRELRANQFAAVFLVPREALVRYLTSREKLDRKTGAEKARALTVVDVVRAQEHFGVSTDMLLWRLQNEDLIGGFEKKRLREELNRVGVVNLTKRLGFSRRDRVQTFERLREIAIKAYAKGAITLGVLAEVFDQSKEEAYDFITALGITQDFAEDDTLLGATG